MVKKRNSNIEALRIISMFMIVISHYCVQGVTRDTISYMDVGINRFLLEFLILGNMGTIVFVLISGYYLINSKRFKINKLLRLIVQIFFTSIIIYLILLLLKIEPFSIKNIIRSLFPITFKMYWFATAYIILYLFHPFINKLLNNIDRREHFLLIIMMLLLFSFLRTLTTYDYYGNELIQFFLFYSIGAYMSKYPENIISKKRNSLKALLLSTLLVIISIVVLDIIGQNNHLISIHSTYFFNRTSPLTIIMSVSLFDLFLKRKIITNNIINSVSPLMFGVYLISSNVFLANVIWNDIFKNKNFINSNYLFLHIISSVLLTFFICLLIEFFRKNILEKKFFDLIEKKLSFIENRITQKIKSFNISH